VTGFLRTTKWREKPSGRTLISARRRSGVRLEREPYPPYRVLERNGYRYRTAAYDDGRFEIEITQG